jgi:preprotein translocase subunit SecF
MFIIKKRKIFYSFSAILIAFAIFATAHWGINFGIDFVGGSILEVEFSEKVEKSVVENSLVNLENEFETDFSVRETGETGYILRSKTITDEQKGQVMEILGSGITNSVDSSGENITAEEIRFNTIGPTLGQELRGRAILSVGLVIAAIILFVAYAFRQVSRPVSSWKYGFVAIIAFIHDVLIPVGVFAILGQFFAVEVDTLFIIAILVVLGYSINDTIVVFDRIRENLQNIPDKKRADRFEEIVGKSLRQTISRSVNTSVTTLIALIALFVLGGEATKWFALALIAGVISGTYSSIFFAAPMLVTLSKLGKNKKPAAHVSENK